MFVPYPSATSPIRFFLSQWLPEKKKENGRDNCVRVSEEHYVHVSGPLEDFSIHCATDAA
jgi:hypothetical protein